MAHPICIIALPATRSAFVWTRKIAALTGTLWISSYAWMSGPCSALIGVPVVLQMSGSPKQTDIEADAQEVRYGPILLQKSAARDWAGEPRCLKRGLLKLGLSALPLRSALNG